MISRIVSLTAVLLMTAACDDQARQAQGFSLPEGDIERGQKTFVKLGCPSCHLVDGVGQADDPELSIRLGGGKTRANTKTYGELVTAVINPTHRTSVSWLNPEARETGQQQMQSYNDIMTVGELVDLVAFLQPQFSIEPSSKTRYLDYHRQKKQQQQED